MSIAPTDRIKYVPIINPAAIVDDDDPVGAYGDANPVSVDTAGFSHARILVHLGATDIALTAFGAFAGAAAASGADDATYSAITGASFTGADLPSATDDGKFFALDIDLRSVSGRYLALDLTVGNGSSGGFVSAICLLSKGDEELGTAAGQGIESIARNY
jgi:hypothetical protein